MCCNYKCIRSGICQGRLSWRRTWQPIKAISEANQPPVLYQLALKDYTKNTHKGLYNIQKLQSLQLVKSWCLCCRHMRSGLTQRLKLWGKLLLKHLTRCDEHPPPFNDRQMTTLLSGPNLPVNAITCQPHPLPPNLSVCLSLPGTFSSKFQPLSVISLPLPALSLYSTHTQHTLQSAPQVIQSGLSWFHSAPPPVKRQGDRKEKKPDIVC